MTAAARAELIFAAPDPAAAARTAMEAETDARMRSVLMGMTWALEWVESRRKDEEYRVALAAIEGRAARAPRGDTP